MSVADVEPPAEAPPQPIAYAQGTAPVTRRQFRFLLLLTLLNTVLLAAFVCGPTVSSFVRSTWDDYQAKRKIRQKQEQQDAILQQAGNFTAPADRIVYEESPIEAARLLGSSSDYITIPASRQSIAYLTPQPWQPPVIRKHDPIAAQLQAAVLNPPFTKEPTVLLHTLKNPNGEERLIWIGLSTDFGLFYTNGGGGLQLIPRTGDTRGELNTRTKRFFKVYQVEKVYGSSSVPSLDARTHLATLSFGTPHTTVKWTKTGTWENGRIDADFKGIVRLYAGQVDPADPTHFTIDYSIDGQRNTIDGYLKNEDEILFVPRAGRIVSGNQHQLVWDPFAAPATRPTR